MTKIDVEALREHLSKFRYQGESDYSSNRSEMTDDDVFQEWSFDCGSIYNTVLNHGAQFVGRKVELLTGWYKGYTGVIKHYALGPVRMDGTAGLSFRLDIYRKDGEGFIDNFRADSRAYYPAYELKMLAKDEEGGK